MIDCPTTISPTQIESAEGCMLKFLLDKSCLDKALPSTGPWGYVGTAFHNLIEEARKREIEDLNEEWKKCLQEQHEKADAGIDKVWLPFEKHHPKLERVRLASIAIASEQVPRGSSGSGSGSSSSGSGSSSSGIGTEVELELDGVRGFADSIDIIDGQIIIKDFKSGSVLEDNGELKDHYKRQLRIYAHLYEKLHAVPHKLHLIDGNNTVHEVPLDLSECELEFNKAKGLLKKVQDQMDNRPQSLEQLLEKNFANIDGGQCGMCQHRSKCKPHLRRLSSGGIRFINEVSGYDEDHVDLCGTIIGKPIKLSATRIAVQLRIAAGRELLIRGLRPSEELDIDEGDQIQIYSVDPTWSDTIVDPGHLEKAQARRERLMQQAIVFHALPNTMIIKDEVVRTPEPEVQAEAEVKIEELEGQQSSVAPANAWSVISSGSTCKIMDGNEEIYSEDFEGMSHNLANFIGIIKAIEKRFADQLDVAICTSNVTALSWLAKPRGKGAKKAMEPHLSSPELRTALALLKQVTEAFESSIEKAPNGTVAKVIFESPGNNSNIIIYKV